MRDLIGRTLGHYRIVERIGAGGMGVVYRAHDERLDRDVAIKVLPEEVAEDPERLHRFEREARALAALSHPNIAAVFGLESVESGAESDADPDAGMSFLVMELLEGESLRELISKVGVTTGKAVEYARAIADGLAAAHEKGIVHRDLKPENVFLTKDGRIKILDFGLAKLRLPETDITTETPTATLETAPGKLVGTVAYMAPEQVQGKPADHRSDIFAFGVVLYEMLTGNRPFGGTTTVETAAAILKDDPEPISAVSPAISPALETVVSKCLEKRPEDRFSSAHDLSLTLSALDSGASAPPVEGTSIIGRRWPHILAVVIAAVIALLVILPPEALFERREDEPAEASLPRIVVLPFENLGSPDNEYFADGMTEEIISRLAAVSGLQVISRTSAMHYKGANKTIQQIGDELNVQFALEGTVRWERIGEGEGRVRITPQLIEVANDRHLWSDRYDRAIESVFEVQSEIARQVVGQLHVRLLKPEGDALSAKPTDNPRAYEAFLRGRSLFDLNNAEQHERAIKMFERAVELDPEYAVAWASLSTALSWHYFNGAKRTLERQTAALLAAERSVELDPALPNGHLALASYHYYCHRDYERALEEFNLALAIRPDNLTALLGRAAILRRQGRWEESTSLFEKAFDASPRDSSVAYNLSGNYGSMRDFRRAAEFADLAISLAPDKPGGYQLKLEILVAQGRYREARKVLEEEPTGAPIMVAWRITLEITEERIEEALAALRENPAVYERVLGQKGNGYHAVVECTC